MDMILPVIAYTILISALLRSAAYMIKVYLPYRLQRRRFRRVTVAHCPCCVHAHRAYESHR